MTSNLPVARANEILKKYPNLFSFLDLSHGDMIKRSYVRFFSMHLRMKCPRSDCNFLVSTTDDAYGHIQAHKEIDALKEADLPYDELPSVKGYRDRKKRLVEKVADNENKSRQSLFL